MNLKQLEVFLAVAETGSFSRGAEKACLTQSTVSQHVMALEAELGIRLLDRTGKGAAVTAAGNILLRHALNITGEIRNAEREVRRFAGLEEAELAVGASSVPAIYLVPRTLALLTDRHPGIRVSVIQKDSGETIELLLREEIEIAVVGRHPDDDRLDSHPLGRDEIRLIVPKDHPWSTFSEVPLRELVTEPLLLREPGSGTGRAVLEALRERDLLLKDLRVRGILGSNEAIRNAVASGAGIGFVSGLALHPGDSVVPVTLEGLAITRCFYAVTRAGRAVSPAVAPFRMLLQQTFQP